MKEFSPAGARAVLEGAQAGAKVDTWDSPGPLGYFASARPAALPDLGELPGVVVPVVVEERSHEDGDGDLVGAHDLLEERVLDFRWRSASFRESR